MAEYICPHCKRPIYDEEALLCLYCGESLNRSVGFMGKIKHHNFKIVIAILVALVVISFLLLMIT